MSTKLLPEHFPDNGKFNLPRLKADLCELEQWLTENRITNQKAVQLAMDRLAQFLGEHRDGASFINILERVCARGYKEHTP